MLGPFRYVLWAAVLVSVGIYGYRAYRRWLAPDDGTTPADVDPGAPAAPSGLKRGLGFRDPRTIVPDEPAPTESLVQAVIREELARKQAAEAGPASLAPEAGSGTGPAAGPDGPGASDRRGLFAGTGGEVAERVSVAAALTGVRLPEGFVPVVGDQLDPGHVTFLCDTMTPAAIGAHLGDELERVGYSVRSEGDAVAVATKGAVTLRLTLHPEAGTERRDGVARWPTASASGVAVELESI